MKTVTREDVTPTATHERYIVEASSLGLSPGEWPEQLETTLGNKTPLVRNGRIDGGYFYLQKEGTASLIVLND